MAFRFISNLRVSSVLERFWEENVTEFVFFFFNFKITVLRIYVNLMFNVRVA